VIAEFNWWLLLLGLVVGAGLTWLVVAETRRRDQDLEDEELADEALWIEARLAEEGRAIPADTIERVVRLHRAYLAIAPPEDGFDEWRADETRVGGATAGRERFEQADVPAPASVSADFKAQEPVPADVPARRDPGAPSPAPEPAPQREPAPRDP
jgi:hypothetical protein